jgi:hypothetical protein
VKILIRKYRGTIYPQDNGYTGAIDVGFDGRGNRIRIKRRGRTKAIVREKLIQAADELDAGITTSDGYAVGDAARDWLEKGDQGPSRRALNCHRAQAAQCLEACDPPAQARDMVGRKCG